MPSFFMPRPSNFASKRQSYEKSRGKRKEIILFFSFVGGDGCRSIPDFFLALQMDGFEGETLKNPFALVFS